MPGSPSKRITDDVFDLHRIRELIELMKQHDLSEIDLRRDKNQIRLARILGPVVATPAAAPAPTLVSAPAVPSTATDRSDLPRPAHKTINSPMVGTFYCRPNPKAEPFIKVGDHVGPESVVCIIEAMKVFNEIPAEVSGRVTAVLASDQDAVEFGTPLFRFDPNG